MGGAPKKVVKKETNVVENYNTQTVLKNSKKKIVYAYASDYNKKYGRRKNSNDVT